MYVAHAEAELKNPDEAWEAIRQWVKCVSLMAALLGE